jgi:hypothetical protein
MLTIVLAVLSLTPAGCATGFRVGGNRYGAGVGGYVGPVPDAIQPGHDSYQPPR